MNSSETAYCRLCAELKPPNKLKDLLTDGIKRREIEEKLIRVNAVMDLSEGILPLTMCIMCLSSLDKAYEFVLVVEQAQSALNDLVLVQQIKKEADDSDSESLGCNSPDEKYDNKVEIKIEVDKGDNDNKSSAANKEKIPTKKSSINRKFKKSLSLDAIPLSQLKLTWSDYNWMCAYCETQFLTIDELKNHSMQYHNCCNAYRCTDCNIRKLKLNSFLIHVRRHRKYLKLSCYKCDFKFKSFTDAKNHTMSHITSQHHCLGCNTCFSNRNELDTHQESFFKDKRSRGVPQIIQAKNSLTCAICEKTFKNKGSLNTHLLTHTNRTRDHICEVCGKCFLHKSNLLGHMTLHNDARPYQCKICKCSFKTAHHLRRHVGIHDGQKPFACDQCGRCFRLQKQLKSHSIIHTDSLPHICLYCNKSFRFKTILSQHLRQHTGVKPYSCSICQRDFTNWPNFNKHMKRRHSMDMAKKKHTPDGVYPINPTTGEMVVHPETIATMEWKKSMMLNRRPGRPKIEYKEDNGNSEKENSNNHKV